MAPPTSSSYVKCNSTLPRSAAQSPGGLSEGVRTSSASKRTASSRRSARKERIAACGSDIGFQEPVGLLPSRPEIFDETQEDARGHGCIFLADRFGRVMAYAALAPYEQHADIGYGDHRHAVVPRPSGHPARADALSLDRPGELVLE